MIHVQFRPLAAHPSRVRKSAPFRAEWSNTLDLLDRELEYLRARDVIIHAGLGLADIRNDGWPRGGRRPSHPAIVLSFQSASGPLSFPCDTYDDYADNLRAIALSIKALRAVNRYGVTRGNEQYRGFTQLPAESAAIDSITAIEYLHVVTGLPRATIIVDPQRAYRHAAKRLHPDHGGSEELFRELTRHMEAME